MKKMLVTMIIFMATFIISTYSKANTDTILLTKSNTVVVRDVVSNLYMAKVGQQLLTLSHKLPPNGTIYIYLDTPGGSIVAGEEFIRLVKSVPQKVVTITAFAASMGFIFVQSLDDRYILDRGILMSHRAYMGEEGQLPGEFNTRATYWNDRITNVMDRVATRLDMSLEDYTQLIYNEYWVDGENAVSEGMADKLVNVQCSPDMSGTYNETILTFFGPVKVVFSSCPLIGYPIEVDLSQIKVPAMYADQTNEIMSMLTLQYSDKKEFVRKYILTGQYLRMYK